jgi:hypothetical protein
MSELDCKDIFPPSPAEPVLAVEYEYRGELFFNIIFPDVEAKYISPALPAFPFPVETE